MLIGQSTEDLLAGTILSVSEKLKQKAITNNLISTPIKAQDIIEQLAPKIVAVTATDHMGSGLSVPRVFFGGNYELADVIQAVSCIDATVFIKEVLERGFGIKSEIKKTRLGIVRNHHYIELNSGSVIDPILRSKSNRGGFFENVQKHKTRVDTFNSAGLNLILRQIYGLAHPKK